jgi:hypothetical protein
MSHYNAILSEHLKIIEQSEKIAQKAYEDILFIEREKKNMPRTIEYLNSIYTRQMKLKQHAENNLMKSVEIIERIKKRRANRKSREGQMYESQSREIRISLMSETEKDVEYKKMLEERARNKRDYILMYGFDAWEKRR